MLKYGDPGYMEEDTGPMLYGITFSFLTAAIIMVVLRYRSSILAAGRVSNLVLGY
jgi:hypothetical protein